MRFFFCTWYFVPLYSPLVFVVLGSSVSSEQFLLYVCRNELIAIERHGKGSTSAGEGAEGR